MPADVIMPMLGMAQETGKVLRWLKQDGDAVRKGEPLLEVETDKVTVEIEAPADGTLAGVRVGEGVDVPVGEVIALVLAEGEAAPVADTEPRVVREVEAVASAPTVEPVTMPSRKRGRLASPKARRLAQERGIDLDSLSGSGPNGAIVAADILRAEPGKLQAATISPAEPGKLQAATISAAEPSKLQAATISAAEPSKLQAATKSDTSGVEVSSVWRVMADRTQRSWQEVPHFFLHRDVDASRLQSWKSVAPEKTSVTDLLVKVCAEALRRHTRINASWRDAGSAGGRAAGAGPGDRAASGGAGGTIVLGERINIGIAVATEDGLVVPVVHDADRLTLAQISERRRAIAEAARAGRLRPEDVQGGSFTISNLGMYGVDAFQAIVNAPQAAILAVGRTTERPWVVDGAVVARPVMTLSLSFDHRVVDGARGAEFLDTLASLIEEPAGLVA